MTKRLAVGLAVSLGLNLLLGGMFVGSTLQRRMHRPPPSAAAPHDSAHGAREPGKRGAMRHAFRERRPEFQSRREATAQARKAVSGALEREPFDAAALEGALAALRKQTLESQELTHRALVQTASAADAETRRQLAAEFSAGFRKRFDGPRQRAPE